jgi:hypothetical protein
MICDPARSEQDLKTMLENVLKKGARDHASVAKAELDQHSAWAELGSMIAVPWKTENRGGSSKSQIKRAGSL